VEAPAATDMAPDPATTVPASTARSAATAGGTGLRGHVRSEVDAIDLLDHAGAHVLQRLLRAHVDRRDARMFEQPRLGPPHPLDGPAQHHLDRRIGLQRLFDGHNVRDVGLVRRHPLADAAVQFL